MSALTASKWAYLATFDPEGFDRAWAEHKKKMSTDWEKYRRGATGRELVKFFIQPTMRDGQKKSVTSKRKKRVPRNRKIREFYTERKEANSKYSIAQLGRDLKKRRGEFYAELRPGGKFPTDEWLRRIVRASGKKVFEGQSIGVQGPNRRAVINHLSSHASPNFRKNPRKYPQKSAAT